MSIHDTHYHLDLATNPEHSLNELESAGIYTIAVTNTPSVFPHTVNLTKHSKYCRAALGLHPELALERKNEINLFREYSSQTRYIGEVGIDGKTNDSLNSESQKEVFGSILSCCADYKNKIITVHSRGASDQVISMIGNNYPGTIILHWFTGSLRDLNIAIEYGFYFSVNYSMLSTNNGKKIIKSIPINRLLTESDGPFTKINGVSTTPIVISKTIKAMASILDIDEGALTTQLGDNFRSVLDRH